MADRRGSWQFWIDRGGTFTDVIGISPQGRMSVSKVLSDSPAQKIDSAVIGIRKLLGLPGKKALPKGEIDIVRMGTTVATNALLEKKGAKVALVVTQGHRDLLLIRDQSRARLFDLFPKRRAPIYARVIEAKERILSDGTIDQKLVLQELGKKLKAAKKSGIDAVAIVCMHGYKHKAHEKKIAALCKEIGFSWVMPSSEVEPLIGALRRGETTVVDAYLTPLLRHYIDSLAGQMGGVRIQFMQSNGGLAEMDSFHGRNSILSGPAGGMIGAIEAARLAGEKRLVSFDMGGTSTDVAHYGGELERTADTEIARVKVSSQMLRVHTVAAGGGSICWYGAQRMQVGPQSAGANPGPACYGLGGPLTVTDCNVALGRLVVDAFPLVFGPARNKGIDPAASKMRLDEIARKMGKSSLMPEEVASDFIDAAVERMAKAIRSISVQRGFDLSKGYALVSFGGAGGQHACQIAERIGVSRVLAHPLAGVLSAAGIGISALRTVRQESLEIPLDGNLQAVRRKLASLALQAAREIAASCRATEKVTVDKKVLLRYSGSAASVSVKFATSEKMRRDFVKGHKRMFGFDRKGARVFVSAIEAEASTGQQKLRGHFSVGTGAMPSPVSMTRIYASGSWHNAKVFTRTSLRAGNKAVGPALILEETATTYVAPGWRALMRPDGILSIDKKVRANKKTIARRAPKGPAPGRLEVYHSVFSSIAEQMGHVLRNTAMSVNIKERLDFSCAVFDAKGGLVANAPHIPVHLGSMGATVKRVISANRGRIAPGDAWLVNAPYAGGSHLPDLTVVSPVFRGKRKSPDFFVCSRGHHAEIGGITHGSMPAFSTKLSEEGVLFDNFQLVQKGKLAEKQLMERLSEGPSPSRDPRHNVADLLAQLAANAKGAAELNKTCDEHGDKEVVAYMGYIQDNAESAVRSLVGRIRPGRFSLAMDGGAAIKVKVDIDKAKGSALIDFSGTSPQDAGNFNAPLAVVQAAIYYVLRGMLDEDIPLNAGCIRPIKVIAPAGTMVNPSKNAAVAAGNVEVSQMVVHALLGALGVSAESQGTMNNLTFGNKRHQYYETICGGTGAGNGHAGMDAVHSHMTNTLITDVEVLENRLPVVVERFGVRHGSGGAGRWGGGNGTIRSLRFLEPMEVTMLANHREIPPFGMAGGKAGRIGKNWVRTKSENKVPGKGRSTWNIGAGDVLEIRTPGGGGWGKP